MYNRALSSYILRVSSSFPVISITGPRQSGKTTLCKLLFPEYSYYNLEKESDYEYISQNLYKFLRTNNNGLIIDEAHKLPELFSAIQIVVDEDKSRRIVLSGSSNFLMMQNISQSLAGRVAIVRLLPLSLKELGDDAAVDTDTLLYNGLYPAVWGDKRLPMDVYDSYFSTYIQRDVQQIVNVKDLRLFREFVRLCATRVGQEFVVKSISDELGIDMRTVNSWISVLEASYVLFFITPYSRNVGKRIIKTPKLYFYDTGLVCYLLGIKSPADVHNYFMRGALFENMVASEMLKKHYNQGVNNAHLYFYRDKSQKEVDIVEETIFPNVNIYEIKSASTYKSDFQKNMDYFRKLYGDAVLSSTIIYDGIEEINTPNNGLINFRHI